MRFKLGMTALTTASIFILLASFWPPLIWVSVILVAVNVPLLLIELWSKE